MEEKTALPPASRLNPYVGPRAFTREEPLYGRDVELRDLTSLLCAERIVLLYSPSGAGKTSLIQAGLVRKMEERRFFVRPVARVNYETTEGTGPGYNRYIFSLLSHFENAFPEGEQISDAELAGMTLADYRARRPRPSGVAFELIILDQFEEILSLNPADQEEKRAFFAQVGKLLQDDSCWALFAMREDYLGGLDTYLKYIPDRLGTTFRLDLLGAKAACQALQRPAEEAGVLFEPEAVQQLVDDLRVVQVQGLDGKVEAQKGPHVEPMALQVAARRLWERLAPAQDCITTADVAALGDVSRALGDYYAQQVEEIALKSGVRERAIREWCDSRLVVEGGIRGQVPMGAQASGGLENRAVRALEAAHLVRAERRGGTTWFELSHDRLVRPVQESNRAWFEQHLSLLQRQAALWEDQGRPEGLLLRAQALKDAEAWVNGYAGELLAVEQEFLQACRAMRERERRERRQNWILRILAGAATLAAVMAVVFGIWAGEAGQRAESQKSTAEVASTLAVEQRVMAEAASTQAVQQRATAQAASTLAVEQRKAAEAASALALEQKNEAERQARRAQSGSLAAFSLANLEQAHDLSLLLAVEANRQWDDYSTRNVLYKALQSPHGTSGHSGPVTSVAFSPDGRMAASGSEDNTILLWDVATGRRLWLPLRGHHKPVRSVAFSPDGKILASGSDDATIILWDLKTFQPLFGPLIGHYEGITSLVFSPDGKILASGGAEYRIYLWDVATGQLAGEALDDYLDVAIDLAFSPDGKILASGGLEKIRLWDVETRQAIGEPLEASTLSGTVISVAFSPNSTIFASSDSGNSIMVWDIETRQPAGKPLDGHSLPVNDIAISPDGKLVASGSDDGTIRLWDAETLQAVGEPLSGHSDVVSSVAFSPDGKILVSSSTDGAILLWDVKEHQGYQEPRRGHFDTVNSLAFSPDGKILASGGQDDIFLWDMETHQRSESSIIKTNFVMSVAFSPDGRILASGSLLNNTVLLWDMENKQPFGASLSGHDLIGSSVAFSPDGQLLASGSADGTVRLWNMETNQPLGDPWTVEAEGYNGLTFSPDGKILATGGHGAVFLWDVTTQELQGEPLGGHSGWVVSVAFSPDGQLLASAGGDKTVWIWDLATRQPIGDALQFDELLTRVAFSPDSRTLAIAYGNFIQLWDAETQQLAGDLLASGCNYIKGLTFSPDGKILATGCDTGAVILWDVAKHRPLDFPLGGQDPALGRVVALSPDGLVRAASQGDGTIALVDANTGEPLGSPLAGHKSFVDSLDFSPDGKILASSAGGNIALWEVASGQKVGNLTVETSPINILEFSPDGHTLASGSSWRVFFWDLATLQPIGAPLEISGEKATSLAYSPDGKILAIGMWDGTILLLDTATHKKLGSSLSGSEQRVADLAFSFDGQTLASGTEDGQIFLWDVALRQYLGDPLVVPGVANLVFWPDRQILVYANMDGVVYFWDISSTSWTANACRIVNRNLTYEEWKLYLSDFPYHLTCRDLMRTSDLILGQFLMARGAYHAGDLQIAGSAYQEIHQIVNAGDTDLANISELAEMLFQLTVAAYTAGDNPAAAEIYADVSYVLEILGLSQRDDLAMLEYFYQVISAAHKSGDVAMADEVFKVLKQRLAALDPNLPAQSEAPGYYELILRLTALSVGANAAGETQIAAQIYEDAAALAVRSDGFKLNNEICWRGSLDGFARAVLPACDRAVSLAMEQKDDFLYGIRDSRGLARALTGDLAGAIEDFTFYADHAEAAGSEEEAAKRREWIEELKAGRNPFTEEVLQGLRGE